eukprot:617734-Hanusia_phi.AAC.2
MAGGRGKLEPRDGKLLPGRPLTAKQRQDCTSLLHFLQALLLSSPSSPHLAASNKLKVPSCPVLRRVSQQISVKMTGKQASPDVKTSSDPIQPQCR